MALLEPADLVEGFAFAVLDGGDETYVAFALRLSDGRLVTAALDADFCMDLRDAVETVEGRGGFDPARTEGEDGARRRLTRFVAARNRIPSDVWTSDLAAAIAEDRRANLVEGRVLELVLALPGGFSGTVWFDEVGALALVQAVADAERRGLRRSALPA